MAIILAFPGLFIPLHHQHHPRRWNKWDIPSDDAFCYIITIIIFIIICHRMRWWKRRKNTRIMGSVRGRRRSVEPERNVMITTKKAPELIMFTYTFLIMLLISFLQWLSLSSLQCCLRKFSPHFHFHFSLSFIAFPSLSRGFSFGGDLMIGFAIDCSNVVAHMRNLEN